MASLLNHVKVILIDLSGTLHIDDIALPGAIKALERLRQSKVPVKFVTNTTKESRRYLYERLTNLGFDIQENEIFSSLWAARDLLLSCKLNPLLLVDDNALEDFSDITVNKCAEYDSVVVGLAPEKFNYVELNNAFRVLSKKGTRLIAIHKGRYYKRPDGMALGPGGFVKALEFAAECASEVVGKPSANFFTAALDNIPPEQAIMIGDDVRDDIAGAQALGMKGILVQTGKYRAGDEDKIDPLPFKVCSNFASAVDELFGTHAD